VAYRFPASGRRKGRGNARVHPVRNNICQKSAGEQPAGKSRRLPSAAELFEHDSIPVTVLLPADLNAADVYGGNAGPAHGFDVRFTIDLSGKKIVDSLFALAGIDPQNRAQVKLPPLAAGSYRFTCSAYLAAAAFLFRYTLCGCNSPELVRTSQNTVLLNQFAIPLKSGNAREVRALYDAHSEGKRAHCLPVPPASANLDSPCLIIALLTAEWLSAGKRARLTGKALLLFCSPKRYFFKLLEIFPTKVGDTSMNGSF